MPLVTTDAYTHIGHACVKKERGHPKPFHKTKYVASQSAVTCGGRPVITQGDSTQCGDPVAGFSSKVKVGGKGVHRLGDATDGHDCHFDGNASAGGHPKVNAG
jgi:uncharacterized Zn-binding protein involved in type VI secretion